MPLKPSYAKLFALKKLLFPGNPKSAIQNPKSKYPPNRGPLNPPGSILKSGKGASILDLCFIARCGRFLILSGRAFDLDNPALLSIFSI